jgi:hypothetical protein
VILPYCECIMLPDMRITTHCPFHDPFLRQELMGGPPPNWVGLSALIDESPDA